MKKYKVNEIFLSIQTEGTHAGYPAVFVRFSGCNYRCRWCDTNHERGRWMTAAQIDWRIDELAGGDGGIIVVFTGGEPSLQLVDEEPMGVPYRCCMETNGSNRAPSWMNWITWSPKGGHDEYRASKREPDEIKMVFQRVYNSQILYMQRRFPKVPFYLQPRERKGRMNTQETVAFVKRWPGFRLSVQTHKLLGFR